MVVGLQLVAEQVAVVGFQFNFYRKMVTHLKSLGCNQVNTMNVRQRLKVKTVISLKGLPRPQ